MVNEFWKPYKPNCYMFIIVQVHKTCDLSWFHDVMQPVGGTYK